MPLIAIPAGHVGTIVTYLEMRERPKPGSPPESPFRLQRWADPEPDRYRLLFRRVGAPWLWYSRLAMNDAALGKAIGEVHVVIDSDDREAGMVELDFSTPDLCLVRFLGLVPELAGRGHGKWLLAKALALAWRPGMTLVKVNTCTLDHPAALPSYLSAGFTVRGRAFESFADPRLTGLLPSDSAPQIPSGDIGRAC